VGRLLIVFGMVAIGSRVLPPGGQRAHCLAHRLRLVHVISLSGAMERAADLKLLLGSHMSSSVRT